MLSSRTSRTNTVEPSTISRRTSAADGRQPRAHSHPHRMRRCLHVVVVVRMSPPHFSPDTAAVSLTPPFPVLDPPLSTHYPYRFFGPSPCVHLFQRHFSPAHHSGRASLSAPPCIFPQPARVCPLCPLRPLIFHGLFVLARPSCFRDKTMSSLTASDRFLLEGRSNCLYRHLDLLFSPACV